MVTLRRNVPRIPSLAMPVGAGGSGTVWFCVSGRRVFEDGGLMFQMLRCIYIYKEQLFLFFSFCRRCAKRPCRFMAVCLRFVTISDFFREKRFVPETARMFWRRGAKGFQKNGGVRFEVSFSRIFFLVATTTILAF